MAVFTRFVGSTEPLPPPTKIRVKISSLPKVHPPTPNNKNKTLTNASCHFRAQIQHPKMIAALLYPLLFVFGLICTLISTIPPTKKFLAQFFQSFDRDRDRNYSPKDAPKLATTFNRTAADTAVGAVELRSVFAMFDKNDDGFITKQELRESLKNIGIAAGERDVEDMVEKVDSNGDGLIDLDEFCKLFDSISGLDREKQEAEEGGDLREAFDVFDGNKDGLITVEELGLVLSSLGFTEGKKFDDCQEMIRKVDVDGDGMVNFDEFKMMMKAGFGRIIPIS